MASTCLLLFIHLRFTIGMAQAKKCNCLSAHDSEFACVGQIASWHFFSHKQVTSQLTGMSKVARRILVHISLSQKHVHKNLLFLMFTDDSCTHKPMLFLVAYTEVPGCGCGVQKRKCSHAGLAWRLRKSCVLQTQPKQQVTCFISMAWRRRWTYL